MNYPSIKSITQIKNVSREQAKRVRAIMQGPKRFGKTRLQCIEEVIGTYGIEYIPGLGIWAPLLSGETMTDNIPIRCKVQTRNKIRQRGGFMDYSFASFYCHCGVQWESSWDSACDDECPICGYDIEPYAYKNMENGDTDTVLTVRRDWTPDGGLPKDVASVEGLGGWPSHR